MVVTALDGLPEELGQVMRNVAVTVEHRPGPPNTFNLGIAWDRHRQDDRGLPLRGAARVVLPGRLVYRGVVWRVWAGASGP